MTLLALFQWYYLVELVGNSLSEPSLTDCLVVLFCYCIDSPAAGFISAEQTFSFFISLLL